MTKNTARYFIIGFDAVLVIASRGETCERPVGITDRSWTSITAAGYTLPSHKSVHFLDRICPGSQQSLLDMSHLFNAFERKAPTTLYSKKCESDAIMVRKSNVDILDEFRPVRSESRSHSSGHVSPARYRGHLRTRTSAAAAISARICQVLLLAMKSFVLPVYSLRYAHFFCKVRERVVAVIINWRHPKRFFGRV